jgi:CRP/FNR family transcriptional regulator
MITIAPTPHRTFNITQAQGCKPESASVTCASCKVKTLCLPTELNPQELDCVEDMVAARISVKRGAVLFGHGDRFKNLYVVRTGFIKTQIALEDGRTRVLGFHMAGDTLGLDAIADETHACDAIAMEDAELCVMPYEGVMRTAHQVVALQRHLHKSMSYEIVRQGRMVMLANMPADQRIANFLLNLSERLHARGYSRSELVLRMSREEIGSVVGLKLETVSRSFSKFALDQVISVKQRFVHIQDINALRGMVDGESRSCAH